MVSGLDEERKIVEIIVEYYPGVQAIYLFGTFGTEYQRADSDVDIAILLSFEISVDEGDLSFSSCANALALELRREVDLINLRQASTVFCKEVIAANRLIYNSAPFATANFEMLTVSLYQKLNEERREILEQFKRTKRAYAV